MALAHTSASNPPFTAPPPPQRAYPDTTAFVVICAGFLALNAVRGLLQPALRLFPKLGSAEGKTPDTTGGRLQ